MYNSTGYRTLSVGAGRRSECARRAVRWEMDVKKNPVYRYNYVHPAETHDDAENQLVSCIQLANGPRRRRSCFSGPMRAYNIVIDGDANARRLTETVAACPERTKKTAHSRKKNNNKNKIQTSFACTGATIDFRTHRALLSLKLVSACADVVTRRVGATKSNCSTAQNRSHSRRRAKSLCFVPGHVTSVVV